MPRSVRVGLIALLLGFFTLVCMLLAMRLAGPVTHKYNLGTLQYEVSPSFSGKAQLFVPLAGWQLEAPVYDAPYTLHVQPKDVDPHEVVRAARGVKESLKTAKKDVKHGAIFTFVRAFMFALAGGLAAALVAVLAFLAFGRPRRLAWTAGACCFALSVLLAGGSGLWVWQSLNISALKRPVATRGAGSKVVAAVIRRLANDGSLETVIQDLAPLLAAAKNIKIPTGAGAP
jgi:hypothetical protein